MYHQLKFSQGELPYKGGTSLHLLDTISGRNLILSNKNFPQVFVYKFGPNVNNLELKSNHTVSGRYERVATKVNFPYFLENIVNQLSPILMIDKDNSGLSIYELSDTSGFKKLCSDAQFGDIFKWNEKDVILKFGQIFNKPGMLGVVGRREKDPNKLRFYGLFLDKLSGKNPFKILDFSLDQKDGKWENAYFADIDEDGVEDVIVRSNYDLEIFKFDSNFDLQKMMQFDLPFEANEELYFENILEGESSFLLHFNSTGMFTYQLNKSSVNFLTFTDMTRRGRAGGLLQFADLDFDGVKELVMSGERGFSYMKYDTLSYDSLPNWIYSEFRNLEIGMKYGLDLIKILHLKYDKKNLFFATQNNSTLKWGEIEVVYESEGIKRIGNEEVSAKEPYKESNNIPEIEESNLLNEKKSGFPVWSLGEELFQDFSIFDMTTGKIKFSLPIWKMSNPMGNLVLNYDGGERQSSGLKSNLLGQGWSIPESFIHLEDGESVFEVDHKYFIILSSSMYLPLKLMEANSTSEVKMFNIEKKPEIIFKYLKGDERWEMENRSDPNLVQIFGGNGGLKKKVGWENWRGAGTSDISKIKITTDWYLSNLVGKDRNRLQFEYMEDETEYFRDQLYLKNIKDSDGNSVELFYQNKLDGEYTQRVSERDENGVQWKSSRKYLSQVNIQTGDFVGNLNFLYEIKPAEKQRILRSINSDGQEILKFSYSEVGNELVMSQIDHVYNGLSLKIGYEEDGKINDVSEKIGRKFNVGKNYRVDYGQDFVLLSYLNPEGRLISKMFNTELSEEIYSSDEGSETLKRFPILGRGKIKNYVINITGPYIIVMMNYYQSFEICFLKKIEGTWGFEACFSEFGKNALVKFGQGFMVILKEGEKDQLHSIEWDDQKIERSIIKFVNNQPWVTFEVSGNKMLVYNDNELILFVKKENGNWDKSIIAGAPNGIMRQNQVFLSKFYLKKETLDEYLNYLRLRVTLKFEKNLVLISGIEIRGLKSHTRVHSLVLGTSYDVKKNNEFLVEQVDFGTFSKEIQLGDGKSSIVLTYYEAGGGKFELQIKEIKGKLNEDLNQIEKLGREKRSEVIEEIINNFKKDLPADIPDQELKIFPKVYDLDKESKMKIGYDKYDGRIEWKVIWISGKLEDDLQKLEKDGREKRKEIHKQILSEFKTENFLIPLDQYFLEISGSKFKVKDTNYIWNGNNWITTKAVKITTNNFFDYQLGDDMTIAKNNEDSIKIYKQGNDWKKFGHPLIDLGVKYLNQTMVKYPNYLATQDSGRVSIFEFVEKNLVEQRNYNLEVGESVSEFTGDNILLTEENEGEEGRIVTFRHIGMKSILPNPIIKEMSLEIKEQNSEQKIGLEFKERIIDYSGSKSIYYEKVVKIPGNSKSQHGWIEYSKDGSILYYDKSGKIVKSVEKTVKKNDENSQERDIEDFLNSDAMKMFDKNDRLEIATFFPYKVSDDDASYYGFEEYEQNQKWIFNASNLRKGFSLTGSRYLTLKKGQTLNAEFKPINQILSFVVSSWIRIDKNVQLRDTFPNMMITVINGDKLIASVSSNVKYKIDDWLYIEAFIRIEKNEENQSLISLRVDFASNGNFTLDIDHVRFSPVNADFQANVFNPVNKNLESIITNNGEIKRFFYDEYKRRIGLVGENGQLQFYETFFGKNIRMRIDVDFGSYESFSQNSFKLRRFEPENSDNFRISQNMIIHKYNGSTNLTFRPGFSIDSFGLKFHMKIKKKNSVLKSKFFDATYLDEDKIRIKSGQDSHDFTSKYPEVIFVHERGRILIWVRGKLVIDRFLQNEDVNTVDKEIIFTFSGEIELSKFFCFHNPRVSVFYSNGQEQLIQEISLNGANSIKITDTIYDEIGREAIKTTPIILKVPTHEKLMGYRANFVANSSVNSTNSVWETGKIFGEISIASDQYSFTMSRFCQDPLNRECEKGLPGEAFGISKKFSRKFSYDTNLFFILNLYPIEKGFNYKIDDLEGEIKKMTVTDKYENKMATYTHIPGHEDSLATYKYNDKNKLIQILPPKYHHEAGTFYKFNEELRNPSESDIALQNELGTNIKYDEFDRLSWKKTPDAGPIEFIYNEELLKYTIFYDEKNVNQLKDVIFYEYDGFGQVKTAGNLVNPREKLSLDSCKKINYQNFISNEFNEEPFLRGRMSTFITHHDDKGDNSLHEEWVMNENDDVISKRIITRNVDHLEMVSVGKEYSNSGQLRSIQYPIEVNGDPFRLQYTFNKDGEISSIGSVDSSTIFAIYEYNKFGRMEREVLNPTQRSNFTRKFNYNAPGFLTRIEDLWLREDIYYTENGYGEKIGYEDGTITSTKFQAKWHEFTNQKATKLNSGSFTGNSMSYEESRTCFEKLQKLGYISETGHQKRILYQKEVNQLPIECSMGTRGKYISKLLGEFGFPEKYGHKYSYGHQRELVQAKYFLEDNQNDQPLMAHSFENIDGVSRNSSIEIWNILQSGKFINVDGKAGTQVLYNNDKMRNDLSVEPQLISLVGSTLINNFVRGSSVSKSGFEEIYKSWKNGRPNFENFGKIWDKMTKSGLLSDPVSNELKNLLIGHPIKEIIKILTNHFYKEIGEAEFDLESFEIDQNGNHKKYYIGPSRYELKYENKSNRVEKIVYKEAMKSVDSVEYEVIHDHRGNIVKAMHKRISSIKYHPVSNRPIKIVLISGDYFQYIYDNQGERISKKRFNSLGDLKSEVIYFRDELGRSLVETEKKYFSKYLPPTEINIVYIYGVRGLIGFYRNNDYYNVITDHEHSTRLVVKNGEVVSAYDYLPYGSLMRKFVQGSSNDLLRYQFTGQEWDDELGLFWFHTRFYDPTIGRFYQIDPKEQYFSPYMYAGNSPISYIDPDGEFAFLITCIVLGIVGAYLGGASANNNWNPLKWKWKESKTWIGIFAGGVTGALMPFGFTGLGATLALQITNVSLRVGLGLGVAYLSAAQGQGSWDPTKWKWENPGVYNSLFQGFASGSGFISGAKTTWTTFAKFSTKWKIASGFAFAGLFTLNGFAHDWDFKSAGIYIGMLNNVNTFTDVTSLTKGVFKGIGKFGSSAGKLLKFAQNGKSGLKNFKSIMKSMDSKLSFKKYFSKNFFKNTGLKNYFKGSIWKGELSKISGMTIMTFSTAVLAIEAGESGNPFTTFDAIINGLLVAKQGTSAARGIIKKGRLESKKKANLNKNNGKKPVGCNKGGKRRKKRCDMTVEERELLKKKEKELFKEIEEIGEKRKIAEIEENGLFPNVDMMQDIAAKVLHEYRENLLSELKSNNIPNTAISLAVEPGKHLYAAVSGNDGPGFIYYKDLTIENSNYKGKFEFLPNNKDPEVGNKFIYHNDLEKNDLIRESLQRWTDYVDNHYAGKDHNPGLVSAIENFKIVVNDVETYIPENFRERYTKKGEISQDFKKRYENPIGLAENLDTNVIAFSNKGIPKFLETEIKRLKMEMKSLDKIHPKNPKFKEYLDNPHLKNEKIKAIQTDIDDLQGGLKNYKENVISPLLNLKNKIEIYNEKAHILPGWDWDNCAEAKVMASIYYRKGISMDNLELYTFKIRNDLEPFETCFFCLQRTQFSNAKTNIYLDIFKQWQESQQRAPGGRKKRSVPLMSVIEQQPSLMSRIGRGLKSIAYGGHRGNQSEKKSSVNLNLLSHFDGNGTLFLFDTILRIWTGQKFVDSPLVDQLGDMEIQGKSLEIVENIEALLRDVFPGFEPDEYLDFGEINSIIFRGLTSGKGPHKLAQLIFGQLKSSPFAGITLQEILNCLIN